MSSVWSVFGLLLFCSALGFELHILHTNDLHSRFNEINEKTRACKKETCYGGFARLSHFFNTHRTNNTLILNAGDSFHGTPLFVAFSTKILLPMMNFLGMDAMSLGNHEFDEGPKILKEFIDQVNTSVVTCNVDGANDTEFAGSKLQKSVVKTVAGVKVGIVGYLIKAVKEMSRVGNVTVTDEIDCIKEEAKRLKANESVKIVIAVGHSGWTKDLEIAEKVEDVDVVIGGHTDTFLYTGTPPSSIEKVEGVYPTMVNQTSGKRVPVVQAFGYTKFVGELNLTFDDTSYNLTNATGNPILITANMTKNENVTKLLEEFNKNLSVIYGQPVCNTLVDLNGDCKSKECNMGNIFADASAEFVEANSNDTSSEFRVIGLVNGGNIRSSLSKSSFTNDTITYGDLATVLPYRNYLIQVRMNGSLLMDCLNTSYHKISLGGFLQMSQMKVTYFHNNKTAEAFVAKKSRGMEKVVLNKTYDVVVTDYLYKGDGYDFSKGKLINIFFNSTLDIVKAWMIANAPVNVTEMGRIVFYNDSCPFD